MNPYFCPLKKEYFFKILDGSQDCEIRPFGHRSWNLKNIYPSRHITFSNGYGKHNRVTMRIESIVGIGDMLGFGIPKWHVDAVEEIYGHENFWLIAFVKPLK